MPAFWLIYLVTVLIRIPNARCLVADDGLVSMAWCKYGLGNDDRILMENLYVFKDYGAKKLIKEFSNEGLGLWGRNKLSTKLQETDTTARRSGNTESIQNISCLSIL